MKKYIVLFFCLISLSCFAQEIKWYVPPFADSVTLENINKNDSSFYENGMKGIYMVCK
ncbi:MAG: hypothetical protein SGJ10_08945 [Bacteroidota bacterium]|nr:hypothetical protein [Bacteroidota bacterium]